MDIEEMNTDFTRLYLRWLKENIYQYKINDNTFRITLPFLDRNNDYIEFYIIKEDEDKFFLTDDGITLSDLELSGFNVFSGKRRGIVLNAILASHGITITADNQLCTYCTIDNIAYKKHMLAQCIAKVSDMFYLNKSNVQSIFIDDVKGFFDENNVRYVEDVSIIGRSKFSTHYDFIISKSRKYPERLIKVVNNINTTSVKNIVFAWEDTKGNRSPEAKLYAFIKNVGDEKAITALKQYDILPAIWSERIKYIEELVA